MCDRLIFGFTITQIRICTRVHQYIIIMYVASYAAYMHMNISIATDATLDVPVYIRIHT